jgi:acetyl-CoA acetyltransferase family protein
MAFSGRRAAIIDVVRSPFCRARQCSALSGIHPVDLYAQVLKALVARNQIDPTLIEDLITGCVQQAGEQAGNIGRHAVLAAGLPETIAAVTLDRKCGSAQQAIDFAAQGVIAGAYDLVIAGGVEMMSVVPMQANRLGKDAQGPCFRKRYPRGLVSQGISAELIAADWNLSREEQDTFAFLSHQRAARAEEHGRISSTIIAIEVPGPEGQHRVARDDGIRRDTDPEQLAALPPAFYDDAINARFPQIRWTVTAGNASQITDGAGAVLIAEESIAQKLGLRPRAFIVGFAIAADDPLLMLTAIMPATRKLVARAGLALANIAAFEVNEAFASVVLAWLREFDVPPESVNRYGGAIAIGHPVGASGVRLMANLLLALEETGGRYGVQTMCESGGMANATLIERA